MVDLKDLAANLDHQVVFVVGLRIDARGVEDVHVLKRHQDVQVLVASCWVEHLDVSFLVLRKDQRGALSV